MNNLNSNSNITVGFIGLGLIGGSIAKRLKSQFNNINIIAYNRSTTALDMALSEGTISESTTTIDSTFSKCDYIFLCAPVEYNIEYLSKLKGLIKPECIITDVGSVKANIHKAVTELDLDKNFIGGHPMAGSEKTGYANSTPFLLENAFYAITKTAYTDDNALDNFIFLIEATGAIPVIMDYNSHDYTVAAISHLPHLIASSLVNLVKESDNTDGHMKQIAAGGFKDITRIASSSPEMWQQICSTNCTNIVNLLDKYIISLTDIRDNLNLNTHNYIYNMFESSREYRNSFSNRESGLIKKDYSLCCDIIDETGAISSVALLLSNMNINIKNIGIVHNREHEEGVLKIIFNSSTDVQRAGEILTKHGYTVYYRGD